MGNVTHTKHVKAGLAFREALAMAEFARDVGVNVSITPGEGETYTARYTIEQQDETEPTDDDKLKEIVASHDELQRVECGEGCNSEADEANVVRCDICNKTIADERDMNTPDYGEGPCSCSICNDCYWGARVQPLDDDPALEKIQHVKPSCANCAWCNTPEKEIAGVFGGNPLFTTPTPQCQLNPPTENGWPNVKLTDKCSEYEAKDA